MGGGAGGGREGGREGWGGTQGRGQGREGLPLRPGHWHTHAIPPPKPTAVPTVDSVRLRLRSCCHYGQRPPSHSPFPPAPLLPPDPPRRPLRPRPHPQLHPNPRLYPPTPTPNPTPQPPPPTPQNAMMLKIKDTLVSLSVKIGIGVGHVSVLYIGGVFGRMESVAVGAPLIQAFESEHHGVSGQVIVSPEVWELLERHMGKIEITKGKYVEVDGKEEFRPTHKGELFASKINI